MQDVIIIGGGVIGLAIARELASRKSVLLLDRGATGQGTSRAAAGMLTPLSEADDQGPFFQLSRASHAMYDESFAILRLRLKSTAATRRKDCSRSRRRKIPRRRFAADLNGRRKQASMSSSFRQTWSAGSSR